MGCGGRLHVYRVRVRLTIVFSCFIDMDPRFKVFLLSNWYVRQEECSGKSDDFIFSSSDRLYDRVLRLDKVESGLRFVPPKKRFLSPL